MIVNVVGTLHFDGNELPIYGDLDEPLFRATDIATLIGYSVGNTFKMLDMCEEDEKLLLPIVVSGQRRRVSFATETGLYNILAQSRVPLARKWRRVIFDELIELRRGRGRNVIEEFDEWDHRLDDLYFDEEKGVMYQCVTVEGGDVELRAV